MWIRSSAAQRWDGKDLVRRRGHENLLLAGESLLHSALLHFTVERKCCTIQQCSLYSLNSG
jgi:hypothetical protein